MKKQTKYLILFILDVLLIILWPIGVACSPVKWYAFLGGALWMSDWHDAVRHWEGYKLCRDIGE